MLLFDIEADGLLDTITKVHCIVIKDVLTGSVRRFNRLPGGDSIESALTLLEEATQFGQYIVAHNAIGYDIPALKKLYPRFNPLDTFIWDSVVISRLLYPSIGEQDAIYRHAWGLPNDCFGSHSLKAWGYRLKLHKGDYEAGWEQWSPEMEDYCVQDVEVLHALMDKLLSKKPNPDSIELEHGVARIITRQIQHGFLFDQKKAAELYAKLVEKRGELEVKLRATFLPFYLRNGKDFTPKSINRKLGYTAGAPLCKVKLTEFNPGSRDHIAHRLTALHGWKPMEFTDSGKPKVDETVLAGLSYPEATLLSESMMVNKRIGQLAEGDEAWLRHVTPQSRIHGYVNSNGAVTTRMTHSRPNMGQVPASYSPYGHECRELFCASKGKVLVGADASALELRCLAGRMAEYDGGDYIKTVVEGKKEDGTEIHTVNRKALAIESRDDAKTWFYAFLYGAGNHKLGTVLIPPGAELKSYYQAHQEKVEKLCASGKHYKTPKVISKRDGTWMLRGKESKEKFLKSLPALNELIQNIQVQVKTRGKLVALDGRTLSSRSSHSALNTQLQSDGSLLMKKALVIADQKFQSAGYIPGTHYEFVANVHDEWQIEADKDKGEHIGRMAVEAMEEAGRHFGFPCPITGEFKVGRNWAETH